MQAEVHFLINYFLDYASYVILERSVASVFDGLKPGQRRLVHAMKIMDDDNRAIDIFIITRMPNTCRAIIIQGVDGKNILPSAFRCMRLVGDDQTSRPGLLVPSSRIQH